MALLQTFLGERYHLLIRQMVLSDIFLSMQGDKLGTTSACRLFTQDGLRTSQDWKGMQVKINDVFF